jgi:GT2 family glycosyltransferase
LKNVYCIVVTYNGMEWIEKCLNSLVTGSYHSKIICIDNGSSDLTTSIIKKHFPSVHLHEASKNAGFGQANNIGLRLAIHHQADYVFLLNQDAWVETDTIAELINVQTQNPEYGIISPVHLNGTGDKMDAYFFQYLLESDIKPGMISENFYTGKKDLLINTQFVNAAAWLISMECLKKTGGFDPVFFHYGEDRNYLQRTKYWDFKTAIYAGARIWHDRELRISKKNTSIDARIKADWIHFLVHACDINQPGYLEFSIKRFARHQLLLLKSLLLLNKTAVRYNYSIAKKIIFSLNRIRQSRKIAASRDLIPHL